MPLPGVVERGLGSLATVEATDERSGTKATGQASENGRNVRRSARASLRINRGGDVPSVLDDGAQTGSGSGSSAKSGKPAGDDGGTGNTPAGGDPEGGGGGGSGAGSPGDPNSPGRSASGSGSGSNSGSVNQTGVSVAAAGQGTGTGASAGTSGLNIDVAADNGGVASEESGSVDANVTDEDGSSTGVNTTLPGAGVLGP